MIEYWNGGNQIHLLASGFQGFFFGLPGNNPDNDMLTTRKNAIDIQITYNGN